MNLKNIFYPLLCLDFFLIAILLTLRRKLYVRKRIKVSYPKDYWTALKTVEKTQGKILDKRFIKVKKIDEKKLKEIQKKQKK